MIVWGAAELLAASEAPFVWRWGTTVAVLGTISFLTMREISYWQDTVSVWDHALKVTTDNLTAEQGIATALNDRGEMDEAIPHFLNVTRIDPTDLTSRINLGVYYASHARIEDGIDEFNAIVKLTNGKQLSADDRKIRSSALLNMGLAYLFTRDYPNALASFRSANQLDPSLVTDSIARLEPGLANDPREDGYLQLSMLLMAKGANEEASKTLANAYQENPEFEKIRELLNYLNSTSH